MFVEESSDNLASQEKVATIWRQSREVCATWYGILWKLLQYDMLRIVSQRIVECYQLASELFKFYVRYFGTIYYDKSIITSHHPIWVLGSCLPG